MAFDDYVEGVTAIEAAYGSEGDLIEGNDEGIEDEVSISTNIDG